MLHPKVLKATVHLGPQSRPLIEGSTLQLGRDPSNDILLKTRSASAKHAELKLEKGRIWVRDNDSRNGTLINDARIPPHQWTPVRAKERLAMADDENITFEVELEPNAAPSQSEAAPQEPKSQSQEAPGPASQNGERPIDPSLRLTEPLNIYRMPQRALSTFKPGWGFFTALLAVLCVILLAVVSASIMDSDLEKIPDSPPAHSDRQ